MAAALLWSSALTAASEQSSMAADSKRLVEALCEEGLNGKDMHAA